MEDRKKHKPNLASCDRKTNVQTCQGCIYRYLKLMLVCFTKFCTFVFCLTQKAL